MRRAFTLVEVLVALAMVVLLAGALFTFTWNLQQQSRLVAGALRRQTQAAALFDQLEADLLTATASAQRGGAGIVGSARMLTVSTRASMLAGSALERIGDGRVASYRLDGRNVILKRVPGGGTSGVEGSLCDDVGDLRFRYFDGSTWNERFDSAAAGVLPVAVEVALWWEPPNTEETAAAGAQGGSTPAPRDSRAARAPVSARGTLARRPSDSASTRGLSSDESSRDSPEEPERDGSAEPPTPPTRSADRVRVILVADAPEAPWKGGAQ